MILDICIEEILAKQGNNVCNSSWGKALGHGLFEFRINRSLAAICNQAGIELPEESRTDSKVLLRVFFAVEGNRMVLLLCGYDKGKNSSRKKQQRLISQARAYLAAHKTIVDK